MGQKYLRCLNSDLNRLSGRKKEKKPFAGENAYFERKRKEVKKLRSASQRLKKNRQLDDVINENVICTYIIVK